VDHGDEPETEPYADDECVSELEGSKLVRVKIDPIQAPLPRDVEAFLNDAQRRVDEFLEERSTDRKLGFFPSDYPLVYTFLDAVRQLDTHACSLCEWGSGFGVVAGLGAFLGFSSCGIEIDPRLNRRARRLLREHRLDVEILEGSFIPEEFAHTAPWSSTQTSTIFCGAGSNDEVDVTIDDFDVIFAFPWPNEEEVFCELFQRFAANGALLMTYHALDDVHVYRKVSTEDRDG